MEKEQIKIKVPETSEELAEAQRAKNEAWGFLNPDRETSVKPIYENFHEGFLTAFVNGKGAGNFLTLRINYDINCTDKKSWDQICDKGFGGNVEKDGDTLYGVSLGVSPKYSGRGIGYQLVNKALQLTVELNCKQFVLGCRIPDYHKYSDIPIDQYITLKRKDGEYLDKELRFYSRCGLRFLRPLPDYMTGPWSDSDCLDYGVLSVWTNPYYSK